MNDRSKGAKTRCVSNPLGGSCGRCSCFNVECFFMTSGESNDGGIQLDMITDVLHSLALSHRRRHCAGSGHRTRCLRTGERWQSARGYGGGIGLGERPRARRWTQLQLQYYKSVLVSLARSQPAPWFSVLTSPILFPRCRARRPSGPIARVVCQCRLD